MIFQSDNGTVFVSELTEDLMSSAYLRKNFFPSEGRFFCFISQHSKQNQTKSNNRFFILNCLKLAAFLMAPDYTVFMFNTFLSIVNFFRCHLDLSLACKF